MQQEGDEEFSYFNESQIKNDRMIRSFTKLAKKISPWVAREFPQMQQKAILYPNTLFFPYYRCNYRPACGWRQQGCCKSVEMERKHSGQFSFPPRSIPWYDENQSRRSTSSWVKLTSRTSTVVSTIVSTGRYREPVRLWKRRDRKSVV